MQKANEGYLMPAVDNNNILNFVHCGIKPNKPGELCGPMARHIYLLHYIIEGKGVYKVNNKTYNLKAGDVFAIFPDDVVSYEADKDEPWYFCWIGFNGTKADEFYKKIGIDSKNPVVHINNSIFADGVFNCMSYINENKHTGMSELRLSAFVMEVLSAFEVKNANKKKSHIDKAITYMELNYDSKITPFDVAKFVNLEYSYFYKLFKAEIGIKPVDYLAKLRIKKARKLLKSDIEIKNIPSLVGISDVYYFSKLFKKHTGITPAEYKKSL